jgi:hypothetical protein
MHEYIDSLRYMTLDIWWEVLDPTDFICGYFFSPAARTCQNINGQSLYLSDRGFVEVAQIGREPIITIIYST